MDVTTREGFSPAQRLALGDKVPTTDYNDRGSVGQPPETPTAVGPCEVQGDAEFILVQCQKQAALLGVRQVRRKRTRVPCGIALERFYLDDLGPQQCQYPAAIGGADLPSISSTRTPGSNPGYIPFLLAGRLLPGGSF